MDVLNSRASILNSQFGKHFCFPEKIGMGWSVIVNLDVCVCVLYLYLILLVNKH